MTADLDKLLARLRELETKDQRIHDAMLDTATPTEREFLNKPRSLRERVFPAMIECATELFHAARIFRAYEMIHRAKDTADGDLKAAANARHAQSCEDRLTALQRAAEEPKPSGNILTNYSESIPSKDEWSPRQPKP